jgi:predicted amino acid racemase
LSAPRLEIHLEKLHHYARTLVERLARQGIAVTGVSKATLGLVEIVHTWMAAGVGSIGEARIETIEALRRSGVMVPLLLVRSPMLSQVELVVAHAAISCNSDMGVLEALAAGACVINALSPEQHRGEGVHYGRPGRIAGSVNVASRELLDPQTGAFLPKAEIRAAMEQAGALQAERVVPYCGGGIAASVTTFWLTRLGHRNVALYDASLSEWVTDPSLPMETG